MTAPRASSTDKNQYKRLELLKVTSRPSISNIITVKNKLFNHAIKKKINDEDTTETIITNKIIFVIWSKKRSKIKLMNL